MKKLCFTWVYVNSLYCTISCTGFIQLSIINTFHQLFFFKYSWKVFYFSYKIATSGYKGSPSYSNLAVAVVDITTVRLACGVHVSKSFSLCLAHAGFKPRLCVHLAWFLSYHVFFFFFTIIIFCSWLKFKGVQFESLKDQHLDSENYGFRISQDFLLNKDTEAGVDVSASCT